MSTNMKIDVYQIVTDRIIELLEQGTVPWRKPWGSSGIPKNLVSKRAYRGVNVWLLNSLSYDHNLFLTWEQLKKIGGSVKKGEKGHVIVFWKTKEQETTEEQKGDKKPIPILRYYKVFNIDQCVDIPAELLPVEAVEEKDSITACEAIVLGMPQCPVIKHQGKQAFYDIEKDSITMPKKNSFTSIEGYYSTLFHELVHSTGHEKRLNRPGINKMHEFGSEEYSLEELVAELGACFLVNETGILNSEIENSAAYIQGWLSKLKNDKLLIVHLASHSQKSVDFITSVNKIE